MNSLFAPDRTKVVFFDMNNTLVDPKKSFETCFLHVLVDFAGRWDPGEADWNPKRVLDVYTAEWSKKEALLRANPRKTAETRKQCLSIALKRYPFQVNDAFADAFFREMRRQAREHAVLFPEAEEAVRKLSAAYTIGVITNGSKEQQEKVLERVGLTRFIPSSQLFASQKVGWRKPNANMFRSALKTMGIKPSEAVMVGDSWKNDITGATACGMDAVWLRRTGGKQISRRKVGNRSVAVVDDFRSLLKLFAGKDADIV